MKGLGEGAKLVIAIVLVVLAVYWILPLFKSSGGPVAGGTGGGSAAAGGQGFQFSKVYAPISSSGLSALGLNASGPGGAGTGIQETLKSFLNELGSFQWPSLSTAGSSVGGVAYNPQTGDILGVTAGPA